MRDLETLTFEEIKTLYNLIVVQVKVLEVTAHSIEFKDEIVSIQNKLADYLKSRII